MVEPMNYLSVCSGIEAATVAWHPLGWNPVGFGEIEKFPSQVLAHHYPNVPNLGDMTKFKEWKIESDVNVLVGGTPCQSFSVAGLRKGLDDPRGNLMLTYLAIAAKYRPKWLVWENVPGVLSSNGGHDFASLLRGMGELGYGFAYRVLDAQYFGVAQRRRRVFVVGYLGNWQRAAAVLFERHSLCGYPAPRREKGEVTPSHTKEGTGVGRTGHNEDGWYLETKATNAWPVEVAPTIDAHFGDKLGLENQHINGGGGCLPLVSKCLITKTRMDAETETLIPIIGGHFRCEPIALAENTIGRKPENGGNGDGFTDGGPMYTLNATGVHGVAQPIPFKETADCLTAAYGTKWNGNASADNGSLFVAQPIPFDTTQITSPQNGSNPKAGDPCHPLAAGAHAPAIAQPMAFDWQSGGDSRGLDPKPTAQLQRSQTPAVMQAMAVRRLTPTECERLQGFPDGYTDIRQGGKQTPDGPRYKALGNSMAVPVMAWIGKRIQEVDAING